MQKGFTLIEILIAMAISGFMLMAVYGAFSTQQTHYTAQEQVAEMQQNIRSGLDTMVREIRMAGYDPSTTAGAGITTANANSITFTYVTDNDGIDNDNVDEDNDSNTGVDEPNEMSTLQYNTYDAFGDGDGDLGRRSGAALNTIAENIDGLEFEYLDGTGNNTATLGKIESVRITILARANNPDQKFLNTFIYTSPAGTIWGPFNDNFRRRLQTVTVQCRNLGT